MIKMPLSERRRISSVLGKYSEILKKLHKKGKKSTEDDLRIVLNDIFSDVLGYDKYSELSTEQRERCGRLDYAVKLTEGPNAKKRDRLDFVVEAKSIYTDLSQKYIDQTMSYCLTTGTRYFILTNGVNWKLFQVEKGKRGAKPESNLIHSFEVFSSSEQSLIEDFYILARHSYLAGNWSEVAAQKMAANQDDIFTIIRMPKVIKVIQKEIELYHGVKIDNVLILDIVDSITKNNLQRNKTMERKLSKPIRKVVKKKIDVSKSSPISSTAENDFEVPQIPNDIKKAS